MLLKRPFRQEVPPIHWNGSAAVTLRLRWKRRREASFQTVFSGSTADSRECMTMDVSGYTTDDLDVFRKVLDRAVAEADVDIPIELMARRLFVAARSGERDPERLVATVLGRAPHPGSLQSRPASTPPPLPSR
jgi:hypothetical protein